MPIRFAHALKLGLGLQESSIIYKVALHCSKLVTSLFNYWHACSLRKLKAKKNTKTGAIFSTAELDEHTTICVKLGKHNSNEHCHVM